MDYKVIGRDAMNVAYEILSSVFGYFPTEEAYEDLAGTQQRHMMSDSAILKHWNEFTHRDDEHQYMVAGEQKDPRYTAAQWELGHKNRPIEETYWALDVGNAFHDILDNNADTTVKIMDIVCGNGKQSGSSSQVSPSRGFSPLLATSPFTSILDDDIRNSDWYDTLLVSLPDNMGGPIHFGHTYDVLESLYNDLKKAGYENTKPNIFHAIMQFPIPINKTDYQGYIAVMPYEKGSISFSNMALLEITERGTTSLPSLGQLSPSFGENAFKRWEEIRPDIRYQSINKRII